MTGSPITEAERSASVGRRWREWLVERNRSGTRTILFIVLFLYPAFGVVDWLSAPRSALPYLWTTRAIVTAATLVMFRLLKTGFFARHHAVLGSIYMLLCGAGISLMTLFMGGLASPYYAGLTLAVVATSLLFVWPPHIVVPTHVLMVGTYVGVNLWAGRIGDLTTALMNLAFLSSTAAVAGIGQSFAFRAQRSEIVAQLALEETTRELSIAHEELRRKDEFKSRFFSNMTHELRTPLAMILAPLELALQGELGAISEAQRGSFATMFKSALKLLKLINDLLDLSKLEEARLKLDVAEHDLVEHLRGLVGQTQVLAQRKNIEMRFFPEHPTAPIHGDLEKLERVFVNLLANAIKFTEPGGRVQVWLLDQVDTVRFEVEDSGIGFPPEKANQLFERFFQVDMGGTRRHGGTGIGLALAKELVQLHGGRIWAKSVPGSGATFTVELRKGSQHFRPEMLAQPRQPGSTDRGLADWAVQLASREELRMLDIAEASDRRLLERDVDEKRRRHTALVVEDTPDVVRLVHLALRRDFRVLAAQDGLKGLELAIRERPSIIITDLMMPGIDGLELTRRLREDPRTAGIPILMLTARADIEDRVAGLDSGANAYMGKPFSVKELLSCARRLVQEHDKTADLVMTQKMDALEIVAAGLAHEINNPLNYVKNALGRVKADADVLVGLARANSASLSEEERGKLQKAITRVHDLIGVADSGLKRIGGTVRLMESYGRSGYSRTLREHDVFAAVREVIEIVLPATGRPVQVVPVLAGDGRIECVPEELNQVLTNLVVNAIEAVSDEDGLVRVLGTATDDEVLLRVIDNGCGIKPEDQAKLFTPFFTTKGPGKGTGMGLSIVWRVVQALHGTIEVVSEVGKGTEFVVKFPRRQPDGVETPAEIKALARAG